MQFPHDPSLYSQLSLNNPLLIFGLGVLLGSIIGLNGLLLLSLIAAGYYHRDNLLIILNKLVASTSNNRDTASMASWLPWNR
jgi:hypothetical protein